MFLYILNKYLKLIYVFFCKRIIPGKLFLVSKTIINYDVLGGYYP